MFDFFLIGYQLVKDRSYFLRKQFLPDSWPKAHFYLVQADILIETCNAVSVDPTFEFFRVALEGIY